MKLKLFFICFVTFCSVANAQFTKLLDFSGALNGKSPEGSLISDGTFLYGMTLQGGVNNLGVIFKIKPDGTGYIKLLDFSGTSNGASPRGSLISDGTFLYGMTLSGGAKDSGAIFKIKPDGTGFLKLHDFVSGANGYFPYGSLISDGTFLYGMTSAGGLDDIGVIFKIKADGSDYTKLLDFSLTTKNGRATTGNLIFDGNFLYGTTRYGGTSNTCPVGCGVIFKVKTDGTGFTKLFDFTGATSDGFYPWGSLISDGTYLYGMTQAGGASGFGILYKIKSDGTGFSKLLDFSGTLNGKYPNNTSLILGGASLFGMTSEGGTNGNGVIFKIITDGTGYVKIFDFNSILDGGYPYGSLISDGTFIYGMTTSGGANNMGVIFKNDISGLNGIKENKKASSIIIFPNPSTNQLNIQSENYFDDITLNVLNSHGQLLKRIKHISGLSFTLDRDDLSSGIYFIQLTQKEKVIICDKFVVTD